MTKLIRHLQILVDLNALLEKPLKLTQINLLKTTHRKGALGAITVLSEIFDLYLFSINKNLKEEEIIRWLNTVDLDKNFRRILYIDESLQKTLLQSHINVTITTDLNIATQLKNMCRAYLLQKKVDNIQDGIYQFTQWREIVRNISLFSF